MKIQGTHTDSARFTEYYIYHFCNINNISGAAFRPHNVYGPDMGLKHVIPQFIIQMLTNANEKETELKPEGNINTTRAFCYVDDITDGLITLMGTDNFEVYNIGSDLEISIRDLAYMLSSSLDLSLNIIENRIDKHKGSTKRRIPNTNKIKWRWSDKVSLKGILKTVSWYKKSDLLK